MPHDIFHKTYGDSDIPLDENDTKGVEYVYIVEAKGALSNYVAGVFKNESDAKKCTRYLGHDFLDYSAVAKHEVLKSIDDWD